MKNSYYDFEPESLILILNISKSAAPKWIEDSSGNSYKYNTLKLFISCIYLTINYSLGAYRTKKDVVVCCTLALLYVWC